MKLIATPRFDRELDRIIKKKRLDIGKRVGKTLRLFSLNPRHPSLRLHKISHDMYSLSIDMNLRILILWEDDQVFLLRIGTHEEVY